jgi:predicted dehydrogenase
VTVGVAVVGCGSIGRKRALALPPGAHLAATYDLDVERSAALAQDAGAPDAVASSLEDAVCGPDVDLVVVATVHDQLVAAATAAVEAGRDVLVEKPGATCVDDLEALRTAAARSGVTVRVGYNHRFHPGVMKLRALVRQRADSEPLCIRARYGHGGRLGYEREWRADRLVSGGGELMDQGSHLIDLCTHLSGPVELAYANLPTLFWPTDVEDNAFIALRLASRGTAWLHASWTEWKNLFSLEVTCRAAKYEMKGLGGSYGQERLTLYAMRPELGPPEEQSWGWPSVDHSWGLELEDMLVARRGGLSMGATLDDAIQTLSIIEEAYQR